MVPRLPRLLTFFNRHPPDDSFTEAEIVTVDGFEQA